jgi:type I restriction enzyme, S subunit
MKAGWQAKTLGEVLQKTETVNPQQSPQEEFDYIDVSSVSNVTFQIEATQRLKGKDAPSRARKLVRSNDVLFATIRPTLQRIAVVPERLDKQVCSTGYFVLRPKPEIDHGFLFYSLFTESFTGQMESLQKGASYPAVTDGDVKAQPFPVPPLPEQHRIVAILDEAFGGIATAKANAEKNLQNARALFESHLQSVFTERGKGWVETTLGEATGGVFTGPFGSLLHKRDYVEDGIPLVNPAHITDVGIESDWRKTVSADTAQRLSSYIMREGDIVIGRRGEMGRCALVTSVEDGWLCGTGSFLIKPSSRCNARYLVRFLRSEGCKQRLEKIAGGAVMPNLSNTDLGNLSFDLPPVERQKAIVDEIDVLASETQHLESLYQQKLSALDDLKKSLLHQAFSGAL